MTLEQTGAGLEARLRITGVTRFIGAAFLSVWLAGWAVGEAFACCLLGWGAWSLLTGRGFGSGREPLTLPVALAGGLFLLFWLSIWTFGGLAAAREFLRLLFARDILLARHDGLEVTNSYGLFRSVKRLPREQIRRFYRTSPAAPLCAETTSGMTVLTHLGTATERAELEQALNAEFNLQDQPQPVAALPKGWCELVSPEHEPILVKDPSLRRKHARTSWILFAVVSLIPMYLLAADRERPDLLFALLFFLALATPLGAWALWLSLGRNEWLLDKGRLLLQRRFGQNRTTRFQAASLELIEDNSGENGTTYSLVALLPAHRNAHALTTTGNNAGPSTPRLMTLLSSANSVSGSASAANSPSLISPHPR